MKEIKIKGIVISSIDYKEKDKLITIYSLERGLIGAKLIGVKNPNAKLKPLKEVFCFADFDLAESKSGDFYIVTSAEIIENFYSIINDIDKFYAGCTVLEILKVIGKTNENNEGLFIETLKALKVLAYENAEPDVVIIKYLVKIFEAMGYKLGFDKCTTCGENFVGKRYFDPSAGEITCFSCKGIGAEVIEILTHSTLRLVSACEYEKLKSLKLKKEGLNAALALLIKNFSNRFDHVLSSANKFPK